MAERKGIRTTFVAALMVVMLIVGLGVGVAVAPLVIPPTVQIVPPLSGELQIGALLPLTGDLASYGENSRVGVELAEIDVNAYLKATGAPFTIKVLIEDTETKAETADAKLKSLAAKGVKLFVGPQTSSEVRRIKEYADANKLLLISQSSTAPDLKIPGDFIYRFCPADDIQGPIGPALAKILGVTHMIYAWRGDAWGDGLHTVATAEAKKLGITIALEVRYDPLKKEFATEVKSISDKVKELVAKGVPPEKIMIEYVAFGEAVAFVATAADYPELGKVKWFGSDGTAQLAELLADPKASKFAADIKWVNPIFSAVDPETKAKVDKAVKDRLGRIPDAYAYSAYAAVWALTLSLLSSGKYDGEVARGILPTVAKDLLKIKLDAGGDMPFSDYTLWVVQLVAGKYDWVEIGLYDYETASIAWAPGFSP